MVENKEPLFQPESGTQNGLKRFKNSIFKIARDRIFDRFSGIYNPYTDETPVFNSDDDENEYPIYAFGTLWREEQFEQYRSEVESGEISPENFRNMAKFISRNLYSISVGLSKIDNAYNTGERDPEGFIEGLILDELSAKMPTAKEVTKNTEAHFKLIEGLGPSLGMSPEAISYRKQYLGESYWKFCAHFLSLPGKGEISARKFVHETVDNDLLFFDPQERLEIRSEEDFQRIWQWSGINALMSDTFFKRLDNAEQEGHFSELFKKYAWEYYQQRGKNSVIEGKIVR